MGAIDALARRTLVARPLRTALTIVGIALGVGVLVAAHASYAKKGWHIKLSGMNKNITNIFVITKLTLVFDVYDTKDEAIKSFA